MHAMDIKEKKILNQEILTILCDDGVHISEILQWGTLGKGVRFIYQN